MIVTTANLTHGIQFKPSSIDNNAALVATATQFLGDVVCVQEIDMRHDRSGSVDQIELMREAGGFADARFAATLIGNPEIGRAHV